MWDIAKKYKTLFDKDQIPQVSESESDRELVSDAYLEVETKRHRQLDIRVYQALTKMQKARDVKIALEGSTEKDRLRMIAWEVKIRTQPVMFVPGDSTLEMDIFNIHSNNSVSVIDGATKDIEIEDSVIEKKGIAIMESLEIRKLTKEQKEKLKQEFITFYSGKKFKLDVFKSKFDNVYADLISLLVREKRLMVLKNSDDIVEIMKYEDFLKCQHADNCESRSVVLFPKIKSIGSR